MAVSASRDVCHTLVEEDVVKAFYRIHLATLDAAYAFDRVERVRAPEIAIAIDLAQPLERFDNVEFE